ncbi:MAG: hypothetical protein ACI8Y4_002978 [Candidatus Poriferisodalaceae bacterium]
MQASVEWGDDAWRSNYMRVEDAKRAAPLERSAAKTKNAPKAMVGPDVADGTIMSSSSSSRGCQAAVPKSS